ncbi:hypothetical protein [Streptomyces sp. NPDC048521]|uniref:hypothetical protein n=1 Tax=Streptomyces sp. NPDC048521 TaxID=3365566 RepID=UPI003720CA75
MTDTDPTAAIEVWARMLCSADVHVYGADHPTWQQTGSKIRDDYRKAAAWLLPRLTVAAAPAGPTPATDRNTLRERIDAALDSLQGTAHHLPWATRQRVIEAVLPAVLPAPDQQAAVLLWAADRYETILASAAAEHSSDPRYYTGVRDVILGLRRLASETQQDEGEEPETDEQRADREETERDHAAGDHRYCDQTCEVEFPTEHLRNFVIAKGYPGTKGALDELLRRAAEDATRVAQQDPTQDGEAETGGRVECGMSSGRDWWCQLQPGHSGDCVPRRAEAPAAVARSGQPETEASTIRCPDAAWTNTPHPPHHWEISPGKTRPCPGVADDGGQEGGCTPA